MSRASARTAPCPETLNRLLAAIAAQDQAAFATLYDLTKRKLFGIALTVLRRRDLAEDVLQEAYIRIWRSAARFDPARGTALTWMATIVRNLAIDVKRAPAAIADDDAVLQVIPFNGRNPLDEVEASDDVRRLRRAIETLDPIKRKLVVAAYIQGQSREQLAARFGAPVNTIKTWLRRAVIDMRAALHAEGGDARADATSVAAEHRA